MAKTKERVFFETLIKLNQYIEKNYQEGATLPSELQLSDLFQVSRRTIRSVLAEANARGYISKNPNKGHSIVPKQFRMKKVGIVVDFGKENPYIHISQATGALIQYLGDNYIHTQLIQASSPENITWRAMAHGVSALVWIYVTQDVLPIIIEACQETTYPQIVINFNPFLLDDANKKDLVQITFDGKTAMTQLARFFIKQGHKSIAFMGVDNDHGYKSFTQELKRAEINLKPELLVDFEQKGWQQHLDKLCIKQQFTAIFVTGSPQTRENALDIINTHYANSKPEIIIFDDGHLDYFQKKFPNLNISAKTVCHYNLLGQAAAQQLVQYTKDCSPMASEVVTASSIEYINNTTREV